MTFAWVFFFLLLKAIDPDFVPIISMREAMPYSIPIAITHLLGVWLGWKVGRRSLAASIASTALSGGLSLVILFRWVSPPYPTLYGNELYGGNLVFGFLWGLFLLQTVMSLSTWMAIRRLNDRGVL